MSTKMSWADRVRGAERSLSVKQHAFTVEATEKIAAVMRSKGIKASDLAERLGTSRAWISKFLHGGRNTTFFTAVRVADALGCDLKVDLVERQTTEGRDLPRLRLVRLSTAPESGAVVIPDIPMRPVSEEVLCA